MGIYTVVIYWWWSCRCGVCRWSWRPPAWRWRCCGWGRCGSWYRTPTLATPTWPPPSPPSPYPAPGDPSQPWASDPAGQLTYKCHCQSLNTLTQSFLFSFLFSLSPILLGWNRDYRVEIVCKVSCPVIPSPPPSLPISSINFLLAQSFSFSLSLSCIPPPKKKKWRMCWPLVREGGEA